MRCEIKLMFIDESERVINRVFKKSDIFSILGVIIDREKVQFLEDSIEELLQKYRLSQLKDILNHNRSDVEKENLAKDISNIIQKTKLIGIASIVGPTKTNFLASLGFKKRDIRMRKYKDAFERVIERFQRYLEKQGSQGVVYMDKLGKDCDKIETELNWIIRKHSMIIPQIGFVNDKYSKIVQVPDIILHALNDAAKRLLETKKREIPENEDLEELPYYNKYLQHYWVIFDRDPKTRKVANWGVKWWW